MQGETFEFLCGYKDEDGVIHKEFELREINGEDEEAIAKKEIKISGAKVTRTLLERCCLRIGTIEKSKVKPKVWQEIIQSLLVGDQDIMLLRLRQISIGEVIETKYTCPNEDCKCEIVSEIDVEELDVNEFKGELLIPFELPKGVLDKEGNLVKVGKLRLPNGFDREIVYPYIQKNTGIANSIMLARCIVDFGTVKVTDDTIKKMSMKDRNYLLDIIKDNSFGVKLQVELECPTCQEEFTAMLNIVNFM